MSKLWLNDSIGGFCVIYSVFIIRKKSDKAYKDVQEEILTANKRSAEFVVGERYRVLLTHVTTPSNFYVEQLSKLPKNARLEDYLSAYYKNEMAEKKSE